MIRFLLLLPYLALIIIAVLDVLRGNRSDEQKTIWILIIVFFPVAGPIIYFLVSRGIIKG